MRQILIVDDMPTNLKYAADLLDGQFKVASAKSGEKALLYLEKNTPDLILLDINMPNMDGYETLQKIKSIPRTAQIPIIFITAESDKEREVKGLNLGAVDFIAKPFEPDVMLSRINTQIEIYESRKKLEKLIAQKTQQVEKATRDANSDTLTGVWNRAYTEKKINELLTQKDSSGALFMLDMDNFKKINDTYGHIVGDETLINFAKVLTGFSTANDTVCRIGGDEFILYLNNMNSRKAIAQRAKKLLEILGHEKIVPSGTEAVSISIGIAMAPTDGTDFTTLYQNADKSLYYVKTNGKNSYHFYSKDKENDIIMTSNTQVDLEHLKGFIEEKQEKKGVYHVGNNSFKRIYQFMRRYSERTEERLQVALFTLADRDGQLPDITELDSYMAILKDSITASLRKGDVTTKFSSSQYVVLLTGTERDKAVLVADRIINAFNGANQSNKVFVHYDLL